MVVVTGGGDVDVVGCGGAVVVVGVIVELDIAASSIEEEQLTAIQAIDVATARTRHRRITRLSYEASSQTETNESRAPMNRQYVRPGLT